MSFRALQWASKQKPGGVAGKAILLMLANYADEEGVCFPGQKTLADDCDCSLRTVQEWLGKLEAAGLIVRQERRRGDGYRSSDAIVLRLEQNGNSPAKSACEDEPAEDGPTTSPADAAAEFSSAPSAGEVSHAEFSGDNPADLTRKICRARTSQDNHQKRKDAGAGARASRRGSRVDGFEPDIAHAVAKGMTERWARSEAEQFVNYWLGIPGQKGVKLNWPATWRNRVIALIERYGPGDGPGAGRGRGPPAGGQRWGPKRTNHLMAEVAMADAGLEPLSASIEDPNIYSGGPTIDVESRRR